MVHENHKTVCNWLGSSIFSPLFRWPGSERCEYQTQIKPTNSFRCTRFQNGIAINDSVGACAEHTLCLLERMLGTESLRAFVQTNMQIDWRTDILFAFSLKTNFRMCQSVQVNFVALPYTLLFSPASPHHTGPHAHRCNSCKKSKPNSHSNLEFIAFSESRRALTQ